MAGEIYGYQQRSAEREEEEEPNDGGTEKGFCMPRYEAVDEPEVDAGEGHPPYDYELGPTVVIARDAEVGNRESARGHGGEPYSH